MGAALTPISRTLLVTLSATIAVGLQVFVMLEDITHGWYTRSALHNIKGKCVFHVSNEADVVEEHIQLVCVGQLIWYFCVIAMIVDKLACLIKLDRMIAHGVS